ncbi:MAG: methyltransferase domain-containing protein [Ruminococcaceae bacterium]|nr:methyltransferase domain-containing protein [Oscillospiraceae bacterium]
MSLPEKQEKINDGLSIYQNEGSLAFGTDAYLLSAYIKRQTKSKAAEFGAGSGVISLLLAARGKLNNITAFEIQEKIAAIAAKNVEANGFSEKINVICSDIRDIPAEHNCAYDLVFSNPPYMRVDSGKISENDADAASRHEVFGTIEDFAASAAKLLRHGGTFVLVYTPDRLPALISALKNARLEPKRLTLVYPTAQHVPCTVLVEAKKGASDGIFITRPLIIYKDRSSFSDDNYTDEMKYIYEHGDFNEFYKHP